ncbi:MAG: matrixin family metalloprotease [Myxococcota bacterium]|nr:matrixin family metalloprotease [Myxococcota bacterium]
MDATYVRAALYDEGRRGPRAMRWPAHFFPLKVYVAPPPKGADPDHIKSSVQHALAAWDRVLSSGEPTFIAEPNRFQADIKIRWIPLGSYFLAAPDDVHRYAGQARPLISRGRYGSFSGEIHIAPAVLADPKRSRRLPAVLAHELGHALGIVGHSSDSRDLMYHELRDAEAPTARDIATLGAIYSCEWNALWVD